MENFNCKTTRQHKDKKNRVGVIFLIIGLVLLGRNLNLVPLHMASFVFSWPMLLIAIGFGLILMNRRNVGGIVLISIGGLLLWNKMMPFSPIQWKIAWPGLFIFIGLIMIFGYLVKPAKEERTEKPAKPVAKKTKYSDVEFDIDKIEPREY